MVVSKEHCKRDLVLKDVFQKTTDAKGRSKKSRSPKAACKKPLETTRSVF